MQTEDRAGEHRCNVLHVDSDAAEMERTETNGDRHADESCEVVMSNMWH